MAKDYYIVNWEKRTFDKYPSIETDSELAQLQQMAYNSGGSVVTSEEFQRRTGTPAKKLREEGQELAQLTNDYIRNPKDPSVVDRMVKYGYDPRTATEKVTKPFTWFAPATQTAMEQEMNPAAVAGGAGIDLASMVLGSGVPSVVGRYLMSRGAGTAARIGAGAIADAGIGAVASGAQQGYGKGGFDTDAAKLGGAIGGGVGSFGATAKYLGPKGFRALSSELSGVSQEALDQFAKGGAGREAILTAKPASDIGERILDDLSNMDELIPESKMAKKILEGKTIPKQSAIKSIEDQMYRLLGNKGFVTPEEAPAFEKLNQWLETLKNAPDQIPADDFRKIRSQIDNLAKFGSPEVGQGSSALIKNSFKAVASSMRQELKTVGGKEFEDVMASWQKKIDAQKDLQDYLGTNPRTREKAVESKIDNLYGRNKTEQRQIFDKFDAIFGKGYSDEIKQSAYAKKLGVDISPTTPIEDRAPAWASQFTTGKSNTGLLLAGATSGLGGVGISPALMPIAPVAAAAWSPRIATSILSEMYNPSVYTKTAQAGLKQAKTGVRNANTKDEEKNKSTGKARKYGAK